MRYAAVLFLFAALPFSGCNKSAPTANQPKNVAEVSKELRASPDKADQILARNGLTKAQFDELMYDVARDPGKATQYRAALTAR
jgi:hypothetical protein